MKDYQSTLFDDGEITRHDIFKNKSYWENMSDNQLKNYVDLIFDYFRQEGFPYYDLSQSERLKEFDSICRYNAKKLLENDHIKQTMHGLGLAWYYFPHSWSIQCNDFQTPIEAFNDDEKFRKLIKKRLKMGTNISKAGIRKVLRIGTGIQAVSNFRPTAAKCIYDYFGGTGVVWDMSSGFGGRLFGALSSKRVRKYIGSDPSEPTYKGLCKIKKEFSFVDKDVELHQIGSEDFIPEEEIDLAFTSPPYFNTEKYTDEPTQSYLKYPEPETWMVYFLMKTVENCYECLKKDGLLILNIANVTSYPTLCEDFLEMMKSTEFTFQKEMKLDLSKLMKKDGDSDFKYEPIYVFKK